MGSVAIPDPLRDKVYREARSYARQQIKLAFPNLPPKEQQRIVQLTDAVVGYAIQDADFRLRHAKHD